jgi:hypothetical protein
MFCVRLCVIPSWVPCAEFSPHPHHLANTAKPLLLFVEAFAQTEQRASHIVLRRLAGASCAWSCAGRGRVIRARISNLRRSRTIFNRHLDYFARTRARSGPCATCCATTARRTAARLPLAAFYGECNSVYRKPKVALRAFRCATRYRKFSTRPQTELLVNADQVTQPRTSAFGSGFAQSSRPHRTSA